MTTHSFKRMLIQDCNSKLFLGAFVKLQKKKTTSSRPPVCLCVCPSAWYNSAPTGRIFMKFDI